MDNVSISQSRVNAVSRAQMTQDAVVANVKRLRKQGLSCAVISARLNLSESAVRRILRL